MSKRVVVLPADLGACGYYRMRLPAGAVQQVRPDWQVEVYRPGDVLLGGGPDGRLWQLKGIRDPRSIDLLVMQRVGTRMQLDLLQWASNNGVATVLDNDDAMWCIDRDNTAYKSWNSTTVHWSWVDKAAQVADMVTVTTHALARRYGSHGRVEVLPNCVPADALDLTSARENFEPEVTLGWPGFTATHPHDLEVVGDAVRRVVEALGVRVRIIGDARGAARAWGLKEVDEISAQPLGAPYFTALTSLDVGLVPLRDSTFNRAKSYLKALELAAMGVTVLASPTAANREIQKTLPIHLAHNEREWYTMLLRLCSDATVRQQDREFARRRVREYHTYEANAERWAQAWERAMTRRARMIAPRGVAQPL